MSDLPPLITHIIYRLDVGGLENGLVNLINHMPEEQYRHAIICLTYATEFRQRIHHSNVPVIELHKRDGKSLWHYWQIFRELRKLKPDIVHTRNLPTIEGQLSAFMAGVPYRIHGEHGWDVYDPEGKIVKYQWLRRFLKTFIHHFVALSHELEAYLTNKIQIKPQHLTRICNGVDTTIFYPDPNGRLIIDGCPFTDQNLLLIGTVGRMHGVKDQLNLVQAFIELRKVSENAHTRLILIGDGPLRQQAISQLEHAGLIADAWLPGARQDVADIMRGIDLFVLPSRAEGISNTILEAMASALPVIATRVGGNAELVLADNTGQIIPKCDPQALAKAISEYIQHPELLSRHGQAGYERIVEQFSMDAMVNQYLAVYDLHIT